MSVVWVPVRELRILNRNAPSVGVSRAATVLADSYFWIINIDYDGSARLMGFLQFRLPLLAFGFPRCSLHIVSDANSYFISTILRAHNLADCFSSVHTNPAEFDPSGALRVLPFHPQALPPHGCLLCPPNMCKVCVDLVLFPALRQSGSSDSAVPSAQKHTCMSGLQVIAHLWHPLVDDLPSLTRSFPIRLDVFVRRRLAQGLSILSCMHRKYLSFP
jgi:hypothetical protein